VKNLFIIDGSIFVTSAAVNPTSTIQALALYIADYIKRNSRSLASRLRRLFSQGIVQIDITGQQQYTQEFTSLSDHQKDGVLRHVESNHPKFFDALVTHTYSGYYSHPVVIRLLGLDVRPPQTRGYELEPLDLGLLEHVKRRIPLYKPV
jgi:hypothetical protein